MEKALEPVRLAAQNFAEKVIDEDERLRSNSKQQFYPKQRVEHSDTQDIDDSRIRDQEIEGLIGTFSKPAKQPSPKSQQHPQLPPTHFATVKLRDYSPYRGINGEVPAPKMGGLVEASISSISQHLGEEGR